jgi:hypothetical protein
LVVAIHQFVSPNSALSVFVNGTRLIDEALALA